MTNALEALASSTEETAQRSRSRRGLLLFFALLIPLSALLEGTIIVTHNFSWVTLLMWIPGLSSIITRLVLREGFADVSFSPGGWRSWRAILFALLFPTAVGLIAYGGAWSLGLAHFVSPTGGSSDAILQPLSFIAHSPLLNFSCRLLLATTLGTIIGTLTAAGEEIGWRGYMLTRLIDARVPKPILLSGLIWGLWHLPLIFSGLYATGPSSPSATFSALTFLLTTTSIAFFLARLRLTTGSIWPPIVLHAAWNAIIQTVFDRATNGPATLLWTGESGILVASVLVAAAFLLSHAREKRISLW
ncbi:CPBP family intramembrane glutamic endopeptidase [Ktedonosporobacter rubrisoli]|nr:CPBP family intramembrane glutamic endopeptidase [Ktedonosporobacter rubrisoli]